MHHNNGSLETNEEHLLYKIIPKHRSQIVWFDLGHWVTWALFGNDDDGIFGEKPTANFHSEEQNSFKKFIYWQARNPLHNLCYYVIGTAHRNNTELDILSIGRGKIQTGTFRRKGQIVFPYKSSCFYFGLHGGKPFISLRWVYLPTHELQFYFGWRERGNFGMKFVPIKSRKIGKNDPYL